MSMSLYELIVLFINILQIKFYLDVFKPEKTAVKVPKTTYERIIFSGTNKNNEVGFVLNQEQGGMTSSMRLWDWKRKTPETGRSGGGFLVGQSIYHLRYK